MSETSNVTVISEEIIPAAVPFYKNPRVLKTVGIVAASAAASVYLYTKFSQNSDDADDSTETVVIDV